MELKLLSPVFLLAAVSASTMGFAIQRGATCTVAAVDEIISKGSAKRLWALMEAALWVALGLGLAQRLQWLGDLPGGYAVSNLTLVGAMLLGLGAWVNKACVFGAIARLGSGEWAYAATPLVFYIGCLSENALFAPTKPPSLPSQTLMHMAAAWALWPLLALLGWRLYALFERRNKQETLMPTLRAPVAAAWSPHAATVIIGITFLVTVVLAGSWAYTDVLAELAQGMAASLPGRAFMALALLVGAMLGGYTAGRLHWHPLSTTGLARCLTGGILMAWGSLLIPGGNDGLILVGMPLFWPYAWVAFFVMCITVGSAQLADAAIRQRLAR